MVFICRDKPSKLLESTFICWHVISVALHTGENGLLHNIIIFLVSHVCRILVPRAKCSLIMTVTIH